MSNSIYWTLVDSQTISLENTGFLSPGELEKLATFRFQKRRNEWLLGRWTAKALIHSLDSYQRYPLDQIVISNDPHGVPHFQLPGQGQSSDCLSISHSNRFAFCALVPGSGLQVGADLEKIEPRTETFILDYFTPAERQLVETCPAEARAGTVTLIWSAKEAMLKALGVGLRWDTRSVEVSGLESIRKTGYPGNTWQELHIDETKPVGRKWSGWGQRHDDFMLTLAAFVAQPVESWTIELVELKLK